MQALPGQLQVRKLPLSPAVRVSSLLPHVQRDPALPLANATSVCAAAVTCMVGYRDVLLDATWGKDILLLAVHRSCIVIGEV